MSDALALAIAVLPGLAALVCGALRWRLGRRAHRVLRRAYRRTPISVRIALVSGFLLVGACHSIDEDAFAHGPVPTGAMPFNEPVLTTDGVAVGEQNGLLGSYFAGAQYDRLDHQQVDPNIDFFWDASDTNPVISAPDGIDHNDGDFRLPDHWPIWSIVWEGYLDTPAEGDYGLRLHVNNGGWLQMKDGSGGLQTIVSCPGGSSFEGD